MPNLGKVPNSISQQQPRNSQAKVRKGQWLNDQVRVVMSPEKCGQLEQTPKPPPATFKGLGSRFRDKKIRVSGFRV